MQNLDFIFKIGLPVYFLGSPSVIEIEEDIHALSAEID